MSARRLFRMVAFAVVLATPLAARAQELNLLRLDDDAANRVHLRTGAEYGLVAGVGYARTSSLLEHRLLVTGDLTLPWAGLDTSDYRVRVGALAPIVGTRRWRLAGAVAPTLRGTRNDIGDMTSVGMDLAVHGGFYALHWFIAGELGFDWAITTHITHSELYRQTVYAGARDGWYAVAGGNARAGLQAGASFGRHDVVLRAGKLVDMGGAPPLFPIYATLTFDTRW